MTAALPVASLLPQPGQLPPTAAGVLPASGPTTAAAPATATPFTALLLGLGRGGTGSVAPATHTATPAAAWPPAAPVAPGLVPTALATAPATASSGPDDGGPLPESGSDLPLPDVTTLLAALESAPDTPVTALAAPPPLPALPVPAGSSSALPDTAALATTPVAVGTDATAATQRLIAGEATPAAQAAEPGTLPTRPDSPSANSPALADVPTGNATHRTESALPAELRARLDNVLSLASGTVGPVDPGPPGTLTAGVAFAATPAPSAAPAAATPTTAAAMPAPLPPLTPGADREAWSQALGERLLMMADRGLQSATLRLQPEHLGPLEVKIAVDGDGAAQVLFSTHHAQAREALETAIPRLRELFADQGLNLAQAGVDTGGSAFTERGFAAGLPSWQFEPANDATEPPALTRSWQLARLSDRQVDILV